MPVPDDSETGQTDPDGPDPSDKSSKQHPSSSTSTSTSTSDTPRPSKPPPLRTATPPVNGFEHTNKDAAATARKQSIPLPPANAAAHEKEPGLTRGQLAQEVVLSHAHQGSSSTPGSLTPSSSSGSDGSWSVPSSAVPSAANSAAPSRRNSASGGASGNKVVAPAPVPAPSSTSTVISKHERGKSAPSAPQSPAPPPSAPSSRPPSRTPSRTPSKGAPPSIAGSDGGEKKSSISLKEFLSAGNKLARRSSNRSNASSRKSDSEGGKSVAGDSTASLLKKYGVCGKIAIGKGATSVVRLAHKWDRSEEKLYAVKEFRKRRKNETEKEYVKKLTAEFCISSTLHHVNIVETVDLVQDENQRWCEVMEFCPGGDLYAAIKKGGMSPSEVECCFKQILTGVSYLHSQGVAHRDIKPENLFFDTKGHLKIGDYGASTVYRLPWETSIHMSTGLCGSEPYIAPEQFLGKPYDARLVDIWACGIVYYCLHFQELPWPSAQLSNPLYANYANACASTNAQTAACPPTINNLSPRACRPVIRKMLEPDPKARSTIEDVVAHAWVQSIEVCHAMSRPTHMHVHAQAMAQAQVQALS